MAWFPGAIRKEVTRHRTALVLVNGAVRGACLHIAVSEAASLFNYFNQPGNPTSHFYVRKDGQVEQYVDTQFRAPANLEGNPTLVSIETQGGTETGCLGTWTAAQVETMAQILAWLADTMGLPLVAMPNSRSSSRGVGYHRLGIDPWRVDGGELWSKAFGKICPCPNREKQIPGIISRAVQIREGDMTDEQFAILVDKINQAIAQSVSNTNIDIAQTKRLNDEFAAELARDQQQRADLGVQFTAVHDEIAGVLAAVGNLTITLTAEQIQQIADAVIAALPPDRDVVEAVKVALREGTGA